MINEILLKQKLLEKSKLENKIIKMHKYKLKIAHKVHQLYIELISIEHEIKELQNK